MSMLFLITNKNCIMKVSLSLSLSLSSPISTGVGNVVLQVASTVGCKCFGIEKADIPATYAEVNRKEA